jgi:hypothetical protein
MTELVTEIMILPDGMELDDPDVHSFALKVRWRGVRGETGRGGYAVQRGESHLSHMGKWRYAPEPFVQRHFRWADIESALASARAEVNHVTVNGRTWAEWQQHFQERNQA